jgi:nucleotide-binding universal stress UspA family protein
MDESPAGEVGLSFATSVARAHRSMVHVVHVNVLLLGGRGSTAESSDQSKQVVDAAVAQLAEAGVQATGEQFVSAYFHLGSRVAWVADQFGADAIVLGSHRHRRVDRLRSQGVRERITRATSLPVLVAPSPLQVARMHRRNGRIDALRLSRSGPSAPDR